MKKIVFITLLFFFTNSAYSASRGPQEATGPSIEKKVDNPTLATDKNTGAVSLTNLQQQIQKLSKESLACKKTSDCSALPMGHKICGGPKMFVIASQTSPNFNKLKELTKKHSAQAKAFNKNHKKGMFSTCSVVVAPPVECKANSCKQKMISFKK